MAVLVTNEDTECFNFALHSFLDVGFTLPGTVLTDQDSALKKALTSWSSHHLYCVYHIYRNLEKNLAHLLGKNNKSLLKDFAKVQQIEDDRVFEREWKSLVQTYTAPKEAKVSTRLNDKNAKNLSEEDVESNGTYDSEDLQSDTKVEKVNESQETGKLISLYTCL